MGCASRLATWATPGSQGRETATTPQPTRLPASAFRRWSDRPAAATMGAMNDILLTLVVVLAGAEIGALIASTVRLPRAVGQIAAGLILGPSLLGVVSDSPIVATLAEIGALCILAIAGLETNRVLMRKVGRAALLAAMGGVLV